MLELSSQLFKSIYNFFESSTRPVKGASISKLSNDIFLDHIFPHLLVEDVCRLRQASRFFYMLTHEPIIWKRYWERMRILRPQLRPSMDYTSAASDHEFEQLVTQACAIDKFWKSGAVWIKREEILAIQFKVIELKFVSGGKFLVASVRDRMSYRFFIIVYAIDLLQGTRAIARMETTYQCYDLDAKYMDDEGEPGIMIYYTRRHWEKPPHPEDIPRETNFDDPGVRQLILQQHTMIYEGCCVHMNLKAVEHLIEQDIVLATEKEAYIERANGHLPPFVHINRFAGRAEITMPTLFEWKGSPYLAFFLSPNEIKLFCLNGPYRATIIPNHDTTFIYSQQRIRAIRAIPSQDQILVIRTVADNPHEEFIHLFELYDIPAEGGVHEMDPATRSPPVHLENYIIDKFIISDTPDPTKKMHPSHPEPLHHELCPPTIWISSSNISPPGVCMWPIRPMLQPRVLDEPPSFRYCFDPLRSGPSSIHRNYPSTEVALPGSERGLVYGYLPSYTEAMIVQRIRRFWYDPELFDDGYHEAGVDEPPVCEAPCPSPSLKKFQDILSRKPIIDRMNEQGGVVSLAYDESSGKIAVGVSHDNEIQLYDTGTVVHPKHKLIYRYREVLKHPIFKSKECMVEVS